MLRKSQFIFVLLVFVAYIPYCISIFSKVSITSDFSNLVLSSNDIISGNLFLKGWNLTGISFLTTDLLYFIVPSLLFGVSEMSYILAISFMFLAASILSLLLSNNKITDSTLKDMIVFFAVVGFPSALEANIVRAHMGAIVWGFAALYYLYKILQIGRAHV